jgi:hypothetical protein
MTTTVITPKFRVSYPTVFTTKKNDLSGKDEYSLVALFPKGADLSALKAAAAQAVKDKWGDKVPQNLRSPFRDQAEKEKGGKLPEGHEAGAIFINMKSTQRPGLVGPDNQPIIDATAFYAGCYARAQVRAYAYDQKGNKGVSFGLQNVQKMEDGESLSGRVRAEDAFQPVAGATTGGSATGIFD